MRGVEPQAATAPLLQTKQMKSAEQWVDELYETVPKVLKQKMAMDFREIQADALRWAADTVKERSKGNHPSINFLGERWIQPILDKANQLHPKS